MEPWRKISKTEIYMFDATGKNHAPGIVSIEVDLPFLPLSRFRQKGDIEKFSSWRSHLISQLLSREDRKSSKFQHHCIDLEIHRLKSKFPEKNP